MSGGTWNYEQQRVEALGEKLRDMADPVLVAIGQQLIQCAEWIDSADRCYAGDGGNWWTGVRDDAVRHLYPKIMNELESRRETLEENLKEITRIIQAGKEGI